MKEPVPERHRNDLAGFEATNTGAELIYEADEIHPGVKGNRGVSG
jgi:hypothetical protein